MLQELRHKPIATYVKERWDYNSLAHLWGRQGHNQNQDWQINKLAPALGPNTEAGYKDFEDRAKQHQDKADKGSKAAQSMAAEASAKESSLAEALQDGNARLDAAMTSDAMRTCQNVLEDNGFKGIPGGNDPGCWLFPRSQRSVGSSESISGGNVINEFDYIAHAFVGHFPYADRTRGRWAGESTPWERRLPFYARLHQMAHYDRLCPRRFRACAQIIGAGAADREANLRALVRLTPSFAQRYARWLTAADAAAEAAAKAAAMAFCGVTAEVAPEWLKAAVRLLNDDGRLLVGVLMELLDNDDAAERNKRRNTILELVHAVDHRSVSVRSVMPELHTKVGTYGGVQSTWVAKVHARVDELAAALAAAVAAEAAWNAGTGLQPEAGAVEAADAKYTRYREQLMCGLLWIAPGRMAGTIVELPPSNHDTLPRGTKVVLTLLRYDQGAQGSTPIDTSQTASSLLLTTVYAHDSAAAGGAPSQRMVDLLRKGSVAFSIDRPTVQFDTALSDAHTTANDLYAPVPPNHAPCQCMLCTNEGVTAARTCAIRADTVCKVRLLPADPAAGGAFVRPSGSLSKFSTVFGLPNAVRSRLTIAYREATLEELSSNLRRGFYPTHTVDDEIFAIRKNIELIKTSRTRPLITLPGQIAMCASDVSETTLEQASESPLWFNNVLTFGVSLRAASYGGSTSLVSAFRSHAHDTKTTSTNTLPSGLVAPVPVAGGTRLEGYEVSAPAVADATSFTVDFPGGGAPPQQPQPGWRVTITTGGNAHDYFVHTYDNGNNEVTLVGRLAVNINQNDAVVFEQTAPGAADLLLF